ncbi:MAG: hypothetical protein EOP09_08130 [Proteobacteria bacterium]|nr:MAG: hypothetical protein EOP09_08130 [Pseudomonadota bacterium]
MIRWNDFILDEVTGAVLEVSAESDVGTFMDEGFNSRLIQETRQGNELARMVGTSVSLDKIAGQESSRDAANLASIRLMAEGEVA